MQPAVSYWGPTQNDVEGRLVYRFEFPTASREIRLRLVLSCFADIEDVAVQGRGAAAIEVSRDGIVWLSLCDNLSPPRWGADCFLDDNLPPAVLGTNTLWVRMRFLMEGSPSPGGYALAQFGRSSAAAAANAFQIDAVCQAESLRPGKNRGKPHGADLPQPR
jgi:hypothetical protein